MPISGGLGGSTADAVDRGLGRASDDSDGSRLSEQEARDFLERIGQRQIDLGALGAGGGAGLNAFDALFSRLGISSRPVARPGQPPTAAVDFSLPQLLGGLAGGSPRGRCQRRAAALREAAFSSERVPTGPIQAPHPEEGCAETARARRSRRPTPDVEGRAGRGGGLPLVGAATTPGRGRPDAGPPLRQSQ